jgi:hypothetical protein
MLSHQATREVIATHPSQPGAGKGHGRAPKFKVALKEPLIYSEVPPAMDGRPAKQSRKRLISRSRVLTRAGLDVGWQVLEGLVQTFV